MRRQYHDNLTTGLRKLGLLAWAHSTPVVILQGRRLTASRSMVEGLPWLHFAATGPQGAVERLREVRLIATLTDRIPAVGVVNRTTNELVEVRLPGWAFAALLRMVGTCDPKNVRTLLEEYLPLGMAMSPEDRRLGSGVLSNLEDRARSSSSISDTDSSSTRSQTP